MIEGDPIRKNNARFFLQQGEWWGLIETRSRLGCCLWPGWTLGLGHQRRQIVCLCMRVWGVGRRGGGPGARNWSHFHPT